MNNLRRSRHLYDSCCTIQQERHWWPLKPKADGCAAAAAAAAALLLSTLPYFLVGRALCSGKTVFLEKQRPLKNPFCTEEVFGFLFLKFFFPFLVLVNEFVEESVPTNLYPDLILSIINHRSLLSAHAKIIAAEDGGLCML